MRIRSHFALMVTCALVPAFVAAALAVNQVRQRERDAAIDALNKTVRATGLRVDLEIQRSLGALTALATSEALKRGDFEAFYQRAKTIDQPPTVWTLLLDETGQQILNTVVPFGTPPPPPASKERVAQVLATGKPLVSDLILGPATGRNVTTLYVPAVEAGGRRYVVAQAFALEHWTAALFGNTDRGNWIVAVVDRTGRFIARSHLAEKYLGQPARPELVAAAAGAAEGLIRHDTLEGIESYDSFTHSATTGWTIAIAAPVQSIEGSAIAAVVWLLGGLACALLAALAAVSHFGRRLIGAVDSASAAATALGHGGTQGAPATGLVEFEALNAAMADAARTLAAERASREAAQAGRAQLLVAETAARQVAEEQNVAKDQFLAMLGHELRTPLAAIAGACALLLRDHPGSPAADRLLQIIKRQNHHLSQMVKDLLDISRLLSGKVRLDERPILLADCVGACIEALAASEQAGRFTLGVDGARAAGVWVSGDPVRLEQIVNNLVHNAFKFSDVGAAVRVVVDATDETARIEVTDAGSGIAAEVLPRVFEPFFQGPGRAGRPASGLGIGLALVRQLVELHRGRITAHSDGLGHGARFVVELPRIAAPASSTAPASGTPSGRDARAAAAASAPTTLRVLLVEDNPDAREPVAEYLAGLGHDVTQAGSGEDALDLAPAARPQVIVIDIGLPGIDGYRCIEGLAALPATRGVPVIVMSGYGSPKDRERSAALGAREHLVKPIDPAQLVTVIERLAGNGAPGPAGRRLSA